ncbi:aromatic ring-hydroxylating dioxygenase subunit alpha [Aquabacterium sp.]|uniref:aromatic ring-hydroxylating oxygenase subunit alpha n=1 Tax=Aquabacterium sp. TaxID=1872578 RepID=UPI002488112E|nr:aromatic ring-hydroxylating dioxygenase subunit alpha [Aquabacterium sp.]MDI1259523.1 aromatic ring-hydroxylating dioxygenase subunit alpha [Aquabacterium sp.]
MWKPEAPMSAAPALLNPQLPVRAYFDEELLKAEEDLLFNKGTQYAGHSLLVPNRDDYCVLPHRDNGVALIHNEQGIRLLSNVCRHRQSSILQGRGNAHRISCPLHRWTYAGTGELLTAPRFASKPCVALETFPTAQWNGMHFTGDDPSDALKKIPDRYAKLLSFEGMKFGHMEVHECSYNWKTFVEFYMEDYHVAPFHPGLGRFVSCEELEWSFGDQWSVQTVGFYKELDQPGDSEVYQAWHQAVLNYYDGRLPPVGAMWFMLYPNIMIEWYPLVTVVSTVYPLGPLSCRNVVEYYHPADLSQWPDGGEMASLAARAYLETAVEDNEIGERMQAGRYALMRRGTSECGPYHEKLEAGMEHFHRYIRGKLKGIGGMS